jgi:transcriptional regulator with XRE-family HTH domain
VSNRLNNKAASVLSVIKSRRKHLNVSQKEMSKHLSVNVKTYQRLETGESGMSVTELEDICGKLDLAIQLVPKEYML